MKVTFKDKIKMALMVASCASALTFISVSDTFAQSETVQSGELIKQEDKPKSAHTVGKTKQFDVYDLEDEIKTCSETAGRISRLICYDNLSQHLGFIPPEEADREEIILATYGFWEATKKRNQAGEEIYYLKNDSVEDIMSRSGMKRKATLIVQCKYGVTDLYLDWKSRLLPLGQNNKNSMVVTYQFDGKRRKAAEWELSTDRNALFVPEPIPFLRNLQHFRRFVVTVTPHNEPTQIIVHEIDGLEDALGLIVRECYGIKSDESNDGVTQDFEE